MQIKEIYRYPVKGLSADILSEAILTAGQTIPYDRHWALAFQGSNLLIDANSPQTWVGKKNLVTLARDEKLAQFQAHFDESNYQLTLRRRGRVVATGQLSDVNGCAVLENFLNSLFANTAYHHIKIIKGVDRIGFTDFAESHLSFININTVKDIERVMGNEIDYRRFRGNIIFEAPPWAERQWVGRRAKIGSAEICFKDEIDRCRATNINVNNGDVDMNIPLTLRKGFGHLICGIYAQVTKDGKCNKNDNINICD